MRQRTIARPVEAAGIGLHKGDIVKIRIEPLDCDSGILFYRSDLGVTIPLGTDSVVDTKMATVIGRDGAFVSTIEHFLSAIYAYSIDNIRIVLEGNEMPIMDGSSISFCLLLDEAGIQEQSEPKKVLRVKKRVEVRSGERFVALEPSDRASFDFEIDFDHPVIGRQSYSFDFSLKSYLSEISRARTFGFVRDIQYLQSQNLALGASLKNAIGLDEHKVLNSEGLRFEDEFVRHKILDAMGDMMVTGYNILGRYRSFAGSHDLNHRLTVELLSDASNYDIVSTTDSQVRRYERSYA